MSDRTAPRYGYGPRIPFTATRAFAGRVALEASGSEDYENPRYVHAHSAPSFYASPQEALEGPPEEFLYLACLYEGRGVESPDFLGVVAADEGRILHETPMPNVGDELHHFGWNRCSSACHGRDRSHLIMPGFRSSRIHIVNVVDDPVLPAYARNQFGVWETTRSPANADGP